MEKGIKKIGKNIRGITLVALVVTIIVLLILAGVAINFTIGEDGIFRKAQEGANAYQNASQNEKIELDKISNYIDNYTNENKSDEEVDEIESTLEIVTGEEKTNTEVNDKYGNKVVVPAGFKIINPDEDVTKGIIIQDVQAKNDSSKGNEFVWIPVGKVYIDVSGTYKEIKFGRYIWDEEGTPILIQEARDYLSEKELKENGNEEYSFKELLKTTQSDNTKAKDIESFILNTLENGGFYIGRYEAGDPTATTDRNRQSQVEAIPVIKKGQYPYNYVTEDDSSRLSQLIYENSDLVNSFAWDTTIIYIQTLGNKEDSKDYSIQDGTSIISNEKPVLTGENVLLNTETEDIQCNIYDLCGNTAEWSTETGISEEKCITRRGGRYISNAFVTSSRLIDVVYSKGVNCSFRIILYL